MSSIDHTAPTWEELQNVGEEYREQTKDSSGVEDGLIGTVLYMMEQRRLEATPTPEESDESR